MEPNPPINRFRHVLKTYKDSKSPWVVTDTAVVALYLTGQDDAGFKFNRLVRSFHMYLTDRAGWPSDLRRGPRGPRRVDIADLVTFINEAADDIEPWWPSQGYAEVDTWIEEETPEGPDYGNVEQDRIFSEYGRLGLMDTDYLVNLAWRVVDLFMQEKLPEQHPHDFLIQWIARELGRASKRVWRGATGQQYIHLQAELVDKSPAIAMWAEQERIDLSKTSAAEALEAIKHFDAFKGEMPQGEVLFRFDDGWTVQKLTADEQLEAEGEAMQHCVGSYCIDDSPDIRIMSLRDERGMPHATMEWNLDLERFTQIKGKQNDTPAEQYRPYLFTFINKMYGGDPIGLMLAGKDPKEVDFTEQHMRDIDFSEIENEVGDFRRVEFTGATFVDCDFSKIDLYMASFNGATLKRCAFQNTLAVYADFEDARIEDVDFADADLYSASFIDATFEFADFTGYEAHTNLKDADFDNAVMHGSRTLPSGKTVAGFQLPEHYSQCDGASFVNSELSHEHIRSDSYQDLLEYAEGLAQVANINNTPLEDWLREQGAAE